MSDRCAITLNFDPKVKESFSVVFCVSVLLQHDLHAINVIILGVQYDELGFPGWHQWQESTCQCRRLKRRRFDPWVGKIPWSRKWLPTPVFLPGESHGQRSIVGYTPWGHKASDTTEVDLACTHELDRFKFWICYLLLVLDTQIYSIHILDMILYPHPESWDNNICLIGLYVLC